jgi:uncharacterized membrane protein
MGLVGGRRGNGNNDTARIETFSDGVFAIAMTLLVIEIGVPHVGDEPGGTTLFGALTAQWPSYLGYVISFLQIGVIWANHHNRFSFIERSDHVLLFLNTLFLMCVAFIPFPTALLAEYIQSDERTTAGAVYSGTLAVTAICFTSLWLYSAANHRLVRRGLNPILLGAMTRRYVVGMILYVFAFALAFFSVTLSLVLIVGLALLFVLPESSGPLWDHQAEEKPPEEGKPTPEQQQP